jgi:hypothetical protein
MFSLIISVAAVRFGGGGCATVPSGPQREHGLEPRSPLDPVKSGSVGKMVAVVAAAVVDADVLP